MGDWSSKDPDGRLTPRKEIAAEVKRRITNLSGGFPKGKIPSQEICLLLTRAF